MFQKTIDAVKAAEAAAKEELDALFVPYNPADGTGGVHWHAAGSSILSNALTGLAGLRSELESREAPIAQAEADAKAAEEAAAGSATEGAGEDASTDGGESAPSTEGEAEPAVTPAPEVTASA